MLLSLGIDLLCLCTVPKLVGTISFLNHNYSACLRMCVNVWGALGVKANTFSALCVHSCVDTYRSRASFLVVHVYTRIYMYVQVGFGLRGYQSSVYEVL